MKQINWREWIKYIIPIIAFIFIAYAYTPALLEGKIVNQSDISSWEGMSHEIVSYNNSHPNDRTLWTNSMFSGMPASTISVIYKGDYTQPIYNLFFTGERPASYLLISLIGGFLLMLSFGVTPLFAFIGAVAITFCSYNMQIIQVGHNSKMVAIAFMPWVIASIVYAYRKSALLGALFFAFTLSFQIKANHPQITYYLAIIILGLAIWQLVVSIREKEIIKFLKKSFIVLVAGLIGIASNANHLLPTYEYAQHTMRGGSELTTDKAAESNISSGKKSRNGLDLDYATQWSYGIGESLNMLIPNLNGGSSSGTLDRDSYTYKALKREGYAGAESIIKQLPLYWGPQPFTAGPMYMGAISIFLAILGLFILKNGLKWWLAGVSILAIMLGWGYHLMPVSEFFFNWAPLYNKFRTVSMILVILQITIPTLAIIAAHGIVNRDTTYIKEMDKKKILKSIAWSTVLTAGISFILILIPQLAGSFSSAQDSALPLAIAEALEMDRISLLRGDAFRTIIFILLSAIILFLNIKEKIKPTIATTLIAVLVLVDLWSIDKRYLNNSHFVTKREFSNAFALRGVDKLILKDNDPHYRVLDLSVNTFNDAYTSYHHKTIGGYSPAKLQRYQDLIEQNITPEINSIASNLQNVTTIEEAQDKMEYSPILSMLNTKYIIVNGEAAPIVNNYRLGNSWFVDNFIIANNANEEIALLKEINPATTAIISANFIEDNNLKAHIEQATNSKEKINELSLNNNIYLTSYAPNRLTYRYNSNSPKVALFSEVYYSPGWIANLIPVNKNNTTEKIPLNIFRANWILRGALLPAGEYDIEFYFNPPIYKVSEVISMASSGLLIILLLITCLIKATKKLRKNAK